MNEDTGTLTLTKEEAIALYLAIGSRSYILQQQGHATGRLKSLQGRVDNIWVELSHMEKVRRGYTGEEIPSIDAVEGLAAGSDFIPYA